MLLQSRNGLEVKTDLGAKTLRELGGSLYFCEHFVLVAHAETPRDQQEFCELLPAQDLFIFVIINQRVTTVVDFIDPTSGIQNIKVFITDVLFNQAASQGPQLGQV